MPPLDAGSERALKGVLALKHGRFHCPCQSEIVTYASKRGAGVNELPLAVDKSDEVAWEAEWLALLKSAKPDCDALDEKRRSFCGCERDRRRPQARQPVMDWQELR